MQSDEPLRVPTILFVDDDADLTGSISLALRRAPFRIVTVNDAASALDLLAREPVDVIVSDDQMPRMSGAELLTAVRRLYPAVMRILLTGQSDIRRAMNAVNDASVFRFLLKPCDTESLVATIEAALAEQAGHAPEAREDGRAFEEILSGLFLAHQPIHDRSGAVAAFELLARSAAASFRGPERLFATAERLGRTPDLERAVAVCAAGSAEGLPHRSIFVNVDPPALARETLFLPLEPFAERVVLEITERHGRGSPRDLAARIAELKQRGFRVAVDDLGSGYAGLNAVVDLAPDIVKLDMALIRDVDHSFIKRRLVRSLCEAANDLGILVVAEGIERLEELHTTFDAGCHFFQGYLLGRPGREPIEHGWPLTSIQAQLARTI